MSELPPDAAAVWEDEADLFASRGWWETVEAAGLPADSRACYLLARVQDQPAALFPLLRCAGRGLASLTTPYSCRYAPPFAPGLSDATRRAVFRAFAGFCRSVAITRIEALPAETPLPADFSSGARVAGLVALPFEHFGNWHELVEASGWDAYLARRPGALRETIRRRLRQADRLIGARFCILDGTAELEPGIAGFEQVYAASWKQPEPFPAFNATLMRMMAAAGSLRLGLWSVDGRPVAAQLWAVERGRATVLKLAHDEAFKAHSPGTVLTALMLRTMLDREPVREIDFGRGDDAYKRGWAAQRRRRVGVVLANPRRLEGLLQIARHRLGRIRAGMQRQEPTAA